MRLKCVHIRPNSEGFCAPPSLLIGLAQRIRGITYKANREFLRSAKIFKTDLSLREEDRVKNDGRRRNNRLNICS